MNITTTIKKITIMLVLVLSSMTLASQDSNASKKNQESSSSLSIESSSSDAEEPIYTRVQKMPDFPGGPRAFLNFLRDNIQYPDKALDADVQGDVHVKFVVKKDGTIDRIQILKGIGSGCDEEAVRVIESVPLWIPGENKVGEAVNVWFTAPVSFMIDMDSDFSEDGFFDLENTNSGKSNFVDNEEENEGPVLIMASKMPEFTEGPAAFEKFLQDNIQYPEMARDANITGKVYVKFIVRKNGAIDNVQVLKGVGGGCDEEAMRVISSMPNWIPGEMKGKPVNVWYTVPVKFEIDK